MNNSSKRPDGTEPIVCIDRDVCPRFLTVVFFLHMFLGFSHITLEKELFLCWFA